jgi:hypothetical protein
VSYFTHVSAQAFICHAMAGRRYDWQAVSPRQDPHIVADDPSQQRQRLRLLERPRPAARLLDRIVRNRGREHANTPHALALLRARREHGRTADKRYELAPLHC